MKYIKILLLILFFTPSCNTPGNKEEEQKPRKDSAKVPEEAEVAYTTYQSEEYFFRLKYPENWNKELTHTGNNQFIFNVYRTENADTPELPIMIHADPGVSFAGIYPGGFGTDLPYGKTRIINRQESGMLNFVLNEVESRVFLLEDESIRGYYLVPSHPPSSWGPGGFIFAQVAVDDYRSECIDMETGEVKDMSECDPMTGDKVRIYGKARERDSRQIRQILRSIEFTDAERAADTLERIASDGIELEQPEPGAEVSSPLEINGRAKGNWYFEGSLNVRLEQDDELVANTLAEAQGTWMTDDYVPFSAVLHFSGIESGSDMKLVLSNSNPSGIPENQKEYEVRLRVK